MNGAIAMAQLNTPIGAVILSADDQHLLSVKIRSSGQSAIATGHPILREALAQLEAWFSGERTQFELPLAPLDSVEGEKLRTAIASIPYGETQTYGMLAKTFGSAAQAIGQACKTNAYPLIIPCHRVVSTNGPEYYSAGEGARTKGWLIDFEISHLPPDRRTRLL
jgi:methylated-DNA-[protein]-cysteine S-methyltransferase